MPSAWVMCASTALCLAAAADGFGGAPSHGGDVGPEPWWADQEGHPHPHPHAHEHDGAGEHTHFHVHVPTVKPGRVSRKVPVEYFCRDFAPEILEDHVGQYTERLLTDAEVTGVDLYAAYTVHVTYPSTAPRFSAPTHVHAMSKIFARIEGAEVEVELPLATAAYLYRVEYKVTVPAASAVWGALIMGQPSIANALVKNLEEEGQGYAPALAGNVAAEIDAVVHFLPSPRRGDLALREDELEGIEKLLDDDALVAAQGCLDAPPTPTPTPSPTLKGITYGSVTYSIAY